MPDNITQIGNKATELMIIMALHLNDPKLIDKLFELNKAAYVIGLITELSALLYPIAEEVVEEENAS